MVSSPEEVSVSAMTYQLSLSHVALSSDFERGYGSHYSSHYGTQYGSGYMQKNPSYNQASTSYSYQNPAFGHGTSSGQRSTADEKSGPNYHGEGYRSGEDKVSM